jgi:hypothetical protein
MTAFNHQTGSEKIQISLSKSKLVKGLLSSILFVLIGFWMLIYQPETSNAIFNNPVIKYGAAVACILFFGLGIFYFTYKLMDKKPGLVIDHSGITDNSSAVAVGHIPWSEITHIATANVMKQAFLIVIIKNPREYVVKQTGFFKRKGMEYNLKNYGSPVSISATTLSCSIGELQNLVYSRLKAFQNSNHSIN